jgi:protein-L-isoaspartate(D-aspartate) O-methyltransferase
MVIYWRELAGILLFLLMTAACSATGPTPGAVETAVVNEPPALEPTPTNTSLSPTTQELSDPTLAQREDMVQTGIIGLGVNDKRVIEAMRAVPRHEFVPEDFQDQAYENHPLPIGFGQTISQPYIVALMTEAAEVEDGDIVLEVGTGSGYQAAVLAEIVAHVYTMEIIEPLATRAESDLLQAGYDNITVRHADGYFGWEEFAPYDSIIVTAAPDHVPQPLLLQLKIGGHLIIPVGPVGGFQTLWRITRVNETELQSTNLGGVRFVPFIREEPPE